MEEKKTAAYKITPETGGNRYRFYCDVSGALVCITSPYHADTPEEELMKRKAGSILTNAGNAADLLSTRYIIRWCLNVPTALPLSMKQDTANSAAQKST